MSRTGVPGAKTKIYSFLLCYDKNNINSSLRKILQAKKYNDNSHFFATISMVFITPFCAPFSRTIFTNGSFPRLEGNFYVERKIGIIE